MFNPKRLRQLRESRGFTQQQLADLVGVERVNITRYESGTTKPDTNTLPKLANALCTTTDYLLSRIESQFGQFIAEARAEYLVPTGDPEEDYVRREILTAFDRDIKKLTRDPTLDDIKILASLAKELVKRRKSGTKQ